MNENALVYIKVKLLLIGGNLSNLYAGSQLTFFYVRHVEPKITNALSFCVTLLRVLSKLAATLSSTATGVSYFFRVNIYVYLCCCGFLSVCRI